MEALFDIHDLIDGLQAPYGNTSETSSVTLNDVCFKPFGTSCATQSVAQYWRMDRGLYEHEQIPRSGRMTPEYCFGRWFTECLSAFGAPIDPKIVLGGFPSSSTFTSYSSDATSFIITLPLSSHVSDAARAWEAAFVHLAQGAMKDRADEAKLSLAFSTERSVQDELARESGVDMAVVALSYFAMLIYIALALSSLPSARSGWNSKIDVFILSRIGLGLGGVLLVALSVSASMGILSALGTSLSLISLEVVPFLSLAIGVDNMFLIVHALQRVQQRSQDEYMSIPVRIATALSASGPSIVLAATCEVAAFSLAALFTPMPAIRTFSLCACLSVMIGFALQVTAFVSLLALDTRRIESRRMDLLPFITISSHSSSSWPGWLRGGSASRAGPRARHYGGTEDEDRTGEALDASLLDDGDAPPVIKSSDILEPVEPPPQPWLQDAVGWYMRAVHISALLCKPVQLGVLLLFATTLCMSLCTIPRISVGLDQSIALPSDSYLQHYYQRVFKDLRVGPPLLLIVRDLDLRHADLNASSDMVKKVCSVSGCDPNSMLNQITLASRSPHRTSIATPASSWIDDFSSWISPSLPKCCRVHLTPDGPCPPPDQAPCSLDPSLCSDCHACVSEAFDGGRSTTAQFQSYLPWFLAAVPSEQCAKGGAGVYVDSIEKGFEGSVKGLSDGIISASSFRAYYTPLNEQLDFIAALKHSRSLVSSLKESLGLDIYSYSMFHVFFEQYLTIYSDGAWLALSPLPVIFTVVFFASGSMQSALITTSVLASLLIHLLGAMFYLGLQLNAISLVNLAMCLGIGVEFAAHICHSFSSVRAARPGNEARVAKALERTGPSVLIGITFTKVVGVAVLSLARTQIFEVYFFRLYLALVALGAAHGLVLLPVLLMWIGPRI